MPSARSKIVVRCWRLGKTSNDLDSDSDRCSNLTCSMSIAEKNPGLPLLFLMPLEKVFWVCFLGPNTSSPGVWKPRVHKYIRWWFIHSLSMVIFERLVWRPEMCELFIRENSAAKTIRSIWNGKLWYFYFQNHVKVENYPKWRETKNLETSHFPF